MASPSARFALVQTAASLLNSHLSLYILSFRVSPETIICPLVTPMASVGILASLPPPRPLYLTPVVPGGIQFIEMGKAPADASRSWG